MIKTKIIAYRIVRIGILMTIAFGFKNKVKFLARTGTKNIYPKKIKQTIKNNKRELIRTFPLKFYFPY